MANFIERNPVVSGVTYSMALITATVLVTVFVLRDNRATLAAAQLESQRSISEQYRTKIDLQDKTISDLQMQLGEYKSWAASAENAIPAIMPRIVALSGQVDALRKENDQLRKASQSVSISATAKDAIRHSIRAEKGEAYIDPTARFIVTVVKTDIDDTATLRLQFPGREAFQEDHVQPGKQWAFSDGERQLVLTVSRISYVGDVVDLFITDSHASPK